MAKCTQIEQAETATWDIDGDYQPIFDPASVNRGALDLDKERASFGICLDPESIAPNERVIGEVRNMMVLNDFIENIEECRPQHDSIRRT